MKISVIIPVFNGAETLPECLDALRRSHSNPLECIVVDDHSTDRSVSIAAQFGATVLSTGSRCGPARARNLGARTARGDLLFFLDSDVAVHPDTLERIAARFEQEPGLDALIGSYDDSPAHPGFISQFKNLMHSFVHQHGNPDAFSFWCGCGAVKRGVFEVHGGLDESYKRPAIEDIEFGLRLKRSGRKLALDPRIQCTHLKAWTLWSLVKTDVFCRGIPWTRLILRSHYLPNDLNLGWPHRLSAALSILLAVLCGAWILETLSGHTLAPSPVYLAGGLTALAAIASLNLSFYAFLASRRGWTFSISAVPLHVFYYSYSSLSFLLGVGLHVKDVLTPDQSRAKLQQREEDGQ